MIAWNAHDLTGQKFSRLTALRRAPTRGKISFWHCRCDCGVEKEVRTNQLTNGTTMSCGCWEIEYLSLRSRTHGHTRNGQSPEYRCWAAMLSRCTNRNRNCWPRYGGAGITVCYAWRQSFEAFLADLGPRPSLEYSLDRIDPFGNYEPGNVRWATRSEQARNTRRAFLKKLVEPSKLPAKVDA